MNGQNGDKMQTFKKFCEEVEGKADLQAMYNRLNKQLFSSELPKIPLKWTNSTRIPGEVQVSYMLDQTRISNRHQPVMGTVTKWKFLGISKKFDLDENRLEGIFIHEMVHVDLIHNGIMMTSGRDKSHGPEFKQKLNKVQLLTNVIIPERETDLKPSLNNKVKATGYIWLNQSGKNFIVKASTKFIQANLQNAESHFMNYFTSFNSSTNFVEIGIANTNALETLKGVRKIPFKGWSSMSDSEIEAALKDKKVLFRKDKSL
jgi:hypothetical protein